MPEPSTWLTLALNLFVFAGLAIAAPVAWRRAQAQSLATLQEKLIATLRADNQEYQDKVERLEVTLATIRAALKRRGITIKINGEYVTLMDSGVPNETTLHITKELVKDIVTKDDDKRKEP